MTIDITSSREQIRKRLLEEYAKILSIDEKQLDQDDTAFNTYVQNTQSYLISDLLFLASIVYRESNAITAQLHESIQNWATYLGYTPRKAVPAKVDVLVQIDISQPFEAIIPFEHKFLAIGDIPFRSIKRYEISVLADGSKKIVSYDRNGNCINVPYSLDVINNKQYLSFLVSCEQYDIQEEQFVVPNLKPFEYFSKSITLDSEDNIVGVDIYVKDGDNEIKWTEKKIVLLQPNEAGYEVVIHKDNIEILFGNGFFGKQPKGVVKVNLKLTKGKKGNIIPGSIISTDNFYSDFPVKAIVTNVEKADGGQDFESIDSIRRNSINSIKMLERIVSEEDYYNVSDIMGISDKYRSKPVLKRSDLACNDIYIYGLVTYNDMICFTNTIPVQVPNISITYPPYRVFNYEDREWVCPYSLDIDLATKTINLVYIKIYDNYQLQEIMNRSEHTKTFLSKIEHYYNQEEDGFIFYCYMIILDQNKPVTQKLKIISTLTAVDYEPRNSTYINFNICKFEYFIPRQNMYNIQTLQVENYIDEGSGFIIDRIYQSSVDKESIQKEVAYSPIIEIEGVMYGLDIPVIEKSYWESLSDQDQINLQLQIIENYSANVNNYKNRMMNTTISTKFVKTLGKTTNTKFTRPDYYVLGIFNSSQLLPDPVENRGSYVALSNIIDPSDPLFDFTGHIAISDGHEWKGKHVGRGTIVKDQDKNIYVSDGVRWIQPYYDLPLKFTVEVHTSNPTSELVSQCRSVIKDYVNNLGIEQSMYLSKIMDLLHNLDYVKYCRIIQPATDIIYKDIMENLTKEDLYTYTPEYLWTTDDNIKIILITE